MPVGAVVEGRVAFCFGIVKPRTTPRAAVTFRKTASVIVPDVWALDAKWVKYSDPTPDKNAIKAAIKAGQEVKGAFLVDGTSMTVK